MRWIRYTRVWVLGSLLVAVAGCTSVPIVSYSTVWENDSRAELEAWVESETEAIFEALGAADGWEFTLSKQPWKDEHGALGEPIPHERCPMDTDVFPNRLHVNLNHDGLDQPFEAIERVRELWESRGWEVSDVITQGDTEVARGMIRADREDGAFLGFTAAERVIVIDVTSTCSMHATLTQH